MPTAGFLYSSVGEVEKRGMCREERTAVCEALVYAGEFCWVGVPTAAELWKVAITACDIMRGV